MLKTPTVFLVKNKLPYCQTIYSARSDVCVDTDPHSFRRDGLHALRGESCKGFRWDVLEILGVQSSNQHAQFAQLGINSELRSYLV